jgi:uncharacterized caspase-like protein
VFLDACRDNPFKLSAADESVGTTRTLALKWGLKEMDGGDLMPALVAFSAEAGQTAVDAEEGDLSPFTKALLEYIAVAGLEITKVMRLVKEAVRKSTQGRQTPWSNDSLTREFFFVTLPSNEVCRPLHNPIKRLFRERAARKQRGQYSLATVGTIAQASLGALSGDMNN